MRIQAEQFGALVAKLDAMQASLKRYETISDAHGKTWVQMWEAILSQQLAIEQGQDKLMQGQAALDNHKEMDFGMLCERLDDLKKQEEEHYKRLLTLIGVQWESIVKPIEQIKGELLLRQFKAKPKRRKKR